MGTMEMCCQKVLLGVENKKLCNVQNPKNLLVLTNHVLNKGYNDLCNVASRSGNGEAQFNLTEHRCNEKDDPPEMLHARLPDNIKQNQTKSNLQHWMCKMQKLEGTETMNQIPFYLLTRTIEGKQQTQIGISNKPKNDSHNTNATTGKPWRPSDRVTATDSHHRTNLPPHHQKHPQHSHR